MLRAGSVWRRATASGCSPATASSTSTLLRGGQERLVLVPLGTRLTPPNSSTSSATAGCARSSTTAISSTPSARRKPLVDPRARGSPLDPAGRARPTSRTTRIARPPAPAAVPRERCAPEDRLRAPRHERHHWAAQGRHDPPPHGGVERLQHRRLLAAPRRRREPDLHAALSCGRPRRVPPAHDRHWRHARPARAFDADRGVAHDRRTSAARSCWECPTIWKMLLEAPEFATRRPLARALVHQRRRPASRSTSPTRSSDAASCSSRATASPRWA